MLGVPKGVVFTLAEIWKYTDTWDYLALILMLFCGWLGIIGIPRIKANAGADVDIKGLQLRALGGAVAGLLYLVVHYIMLIDALKQ